MLSTKQIYVHKGVNGVLTGKHYNRAWSIHECLSEALHVLFYEAEPDLLSFTDDFQKLLQCSIDEATLRNLIHRPEFIVHRNKYEKLRNQYLIGEKGKTAQFWMFYLWLIEIQFHYSINVNDFHLQLYCWKTTVQLCFSTINLLSHL